MNDDVINLVDLPYFEVVESENNLIFTFKEQKTFEVGETITIWTSELVEKRIAESRVKKLEKELEDERKNLESFK